MILDPAQSLRAFEHRGLFTRVAHKLQLGPSGRSHVSRVARGERHSPRVEAAILEELQRLEGLLEVGEDKSHLPDPASQTAPLPGSYDDASAIRDTLVRSIDASGLSRATIADRMSYLLSRTVTEQMLNAFTAESRPDRRWPAEFDRAFCEATGDPTLLRDRVERAGFRTITRTEEKLFELGRQVLIQKRAAAAVAAIELELAEVQL